MVAYLHFIITHITTTTLEFYYMSPVVETKLSNTTIIITKENLNRVSIGVLEYLKYDRETPHTDSYESSATFLNVSYLNSIIDWSFTLY